MSEKSESKNWVIPASKHVNNNYPYRRLFFHAIYQTVPISMGNEKVFLIGNAEKDRSTFLHTYTVMNSEGKEETNRQKIAETHQLTMHLQLETYLRKLMEAFDKQKRQVTSREAVKSKIDGIHTRPEDENNLKLSLEAFDQIEHSDFVTIEEAQNVTQRITVFFQGYEERYKKIQEISKNEGLLKETVFSEEENNGLKLEQVTLMKLYRELADWVGENIDPVTSIPSLIKAHGEMLYEKKVDQKSEFLARFEKINVYLIEKLRIFMYVVYLPLALIVFIISLNVFVFAFPLIYFFGLKQILARYLPNYKTKHRLEFVRSHRKPSIIGTNSHDNNPDYFRLEVKSMKMTYEVYITFFVMLGISLFLSFTQGFSGITMFSYGLSAFLLVLAWIIPRLKMSNRGLIFKKGEIELSKATRIYSDQIFRLYLLRSEKQLRINVGTAKHEEQDFQFKEPAQVEDAIIKLKGWAKQEDLSLEVYENEKESKARTSA